MKKQQHKLQLTKSKVASLKTNLLFGGTIGNGTLHGYDNVTIDGSDCANTLLISCHEPGRTTHGRPRTNADSPCGNTTNAGLHSNNDCMHETVNSEC